MITTSFIEENAYEALNAGIRSNNMIIVNAALEKINKEELDFSILETAIIAKNLRIFRKLLPLINVDENQVILFCISKNSHAIFNFVVSNKTFDENFLKIMLREAAYFNNIEAVKFIHQNDYDLKKDVWSSRIAFENNNFDVWNYLALNGCVYLPILSANSKHIWNLLKTK